MKRILLKRAGEVTLGKMLQSEPRTADDALRMYLRAAHIQPDGVTWAVESKSMWFSPAEANDLDLRADDVLIVEGGAGYGRSDVLHSDIPGTGFQNSIVRVRPHPNSADGRFLNYAIRSARSSGQIEALCSTATIPHFTAEKIAALPITFPSLDRQQRIAAHLDRETAQIDTLIAKQEQLIATLRERRTAVIEHTLTTLSARENTAMIPIRHLGTTASGAGFPPGEQGQTDLELPFFKVKHLAVKGDLTRDVADDTISVATAARLRATVFPPGTICYAKVGAALLLGRFRRMSVAACMDNNMSGLIPNDRTLPEYLQWALMGVRFDALVNPGAVPSLSDRNFVEWKLPVPSINDQVATERSLREQTSKIDTLIAKAERFIELSKERRAALITAAVTGQIEVPAG